MYHAFALNPITPKIWKICQLNRYLIFVPRPCSFRTWLIVRKQRISLDHFTLRNDMMSFSLSTHRLQYHLATACVGKVFYGCVGNFLTQNKSRGVLNQVLINEKKMCEDGPLEAFGNPERSHPTHNVTCRGNYSEKYAMCGKTLQQKFVTNPSDTSLCRY